MFGRPATLAMLLCSMIVTGCSDSAGTPCTLDSECPSHFCKADGTCGMAEVDAGGGDVQSDAPAGVCNPNHDGMISLSELPLMAGKMARFRIATGATFDTTGTSAGGGMRAWDLTAQLANDTDTQLSLSAPSGQWWAADFPTATYAATLAAGSDLLGVFHVEPSQVTLLGVVSPAAGTFRTELTYDPAVKILALPLAASSTWMSTSTVSGTAQGVIAAYTEKYVSLVDQVGTMKTPYGTFPVLRVATDLTRTSGFTTLLTKRQFAWTAECFGSVATVASQDFETSAEFNNPAEVKRLAP